MTFITVLPGSGKAGAVQMTRVALEAETGAELTVRPLADISNWQRYVLPAVVAKLVPVTVIKNSPPNRPVVGAIDCHEACAFMLGTIQQKARSNRAR